MLAQAEARNPTIEREADILRTILDYLKVHRVFHWRNNVGGVKWVRESKSRFVRFGTPGAPDIFVVYRSRIIGIEVKAVKGHPSDVQIKFGSDLESAGGLYMVARSIQEVDAMLRYVERDKA